MATTQSDDEVRAIEAGAAPTRFARGWHCLGLADTWVLPLDPGHLTQDP